MPTLLRDGECDAACNTESCDWDGGRLLPPSRSRRRALVPCAPGSRPCPLRLNGSPPLQASARRDDGADYRGTVKTTKDGVECQALLPAMLGRPQPCSLPTRSSRVPQSWSEQEPQQHTKTHANYPRAGLGGHTFCRNPDGEPPAAPLPVAAARVHSPPAFQVKQGRGATQSTSGYAGTTATSASLRPEPATRHRRRRRRRPRRSRHRLRRLRRRRLHRVRRRLCRVRASARAMLGGDGVCDAACNTTSCLWDAGDCKDVLEGVLKEAGLAQADVLRSSRIGELIADEGGYLKQAPAAQGHPPPHTAHALRRFCTSSGDVRWCACRARCRAVQRLRALLPAGAPPAAVDEPQIYADGRVVNKNDSRP